MSSDLELTSALNLMRRLPPALTESSLSGLINLLPELTEELLQRVDQPLKTCKDAKSGKTFVLCDYNRDGDSYRSPFSNTYVPPLDDGFLPPAKLRQMEIEANTLFDVYRQLYFEDNSYSSVYFWDIGNNSFAACWLIAKDVEGVRGLTAGSWNSIHVFEVNEEKMKGGKFEYKLTTTVIISMAVKNGQVGSVDLSGSMTKQASVVGELTEEKSHVANMGKMIEETELTIRNALEGVYIQKTREVINGMRNVSGQQTQLHSFTESLKDAVGKHGTRRMKDSE